MRLLLILVAVLAMLGCRRTKTVEPTRQDVLLPGTFQPGTVDEAAAIEIARRCVSSNDTWSVRAVYKARRKGSKWSVIATRIEGYSSEGKPQFAYGGERYIEIDELGAVTSYLRGL